MPALQENGPERFRMEQIISRLQRHPSGWGVDDEGRLPSLKDLNPDPEKIVFVYRDCVAKMDQWCTDKGDGDNDPVNARAAVSPFDHQAWQIACQQKAMAVDEAFIDLGDQVDDDEAVDKALDEKNNGSFSFMNSATGDRVRFYSLDNPRQVRLLDGYYPSCI